MYLGLTLIKVYAEFWGESPKTHGGIVMYYTKFIASPFQCFNTNIYIADMLTDIIELVRQNDGETLIDATLIFAQSDHPYLCQYIDLYIGEEGDQELIKLCNQIGSYVMKIMAVYVDVFECICLHQDISYTMSALKTGIIVRFYEDDFY